MSNEAFIQAMISQLGQSQEERLAPELQARFVDIDERSARELFGYVVALAKRVNHHGKNGGTPGDWTSFFRAADVALLDTANGQVEPHLALMGAFLKLYEYPRGEMNKLTEAHLDFYYRKVLGFAPRAAVADRAHLAIELKKNVAPIRILPEHAFSAGKDARGVELIYRPVRETVINSARVESLRSIYVDPEGSAGGVHSAPIAKSSNGVGAELTPEAPGFRPFGHGGLPNAPVGFALCSRVLRLAEGKRTVRIFLELEDVGQAARAGLSGENVFEAHVTSTSGWLGPFTVTCTLSENHLELSFALPKTAGPMVDYSAAVHVQPFAADAPVVQLLLREHASVGFHALKSLVVTRASITVDVSEFTSLMLESDAGTLDPKKTFLPFGPEPRADARFLVGCAEALDKKLDDLSLRISWHALPDLESQYSWYKTTPKITANTFTAVCSYQDANHDAPHSFTSHLFVTSGADAVTVISAKTDQVQTIKLSDAWRVYELRTAGSLAAQRYSESYVRVLPSYDLFQAPPPKVRDAFITLRLERGMLIDEQREATIAALIAASKPSASGDVHLPKPPYIPAIENISLSYTASIQPVDLNTATVDAFAGAEARFFHVDAFGVRQEHAHLRGQHDFLSGTRVPLLPEHPAQGELLIGLSKLAAGDSLSLLFQILAGSADPDITLPPLSWHVLCDNYWKLLSSAELVLDATHELRSSGIVAIVLPDEATQSNTLLPTGRLWLKVQVETPTNASKVSQLLDVVANAIEVEFQDRSNDPAHAESPLAKAQISRIKTPIPAIKSIVQPSPSFGGAPTESSSALRARAAERLRHKDRCITPWDYERSVLEAFPEIGRAKCIPHAKKAAFQAPGHVLLVVVPTPSSASTQDPREPKADQETLGRIRDFLAPRTGMNVDLSVSNPIYQRVRTDFKVRFRRGFEFNAYRTLLEQELIAFLSPWMSKDHASSTTPPGFGGRVYRSALVNFVEERPYVDYVTDFRMYTSLTAQPGNQDVGEARPLTPDAILVSDSEHAIAQVSAP